MRECTSLDVKASGTLPQLYLLTPQDFLSFVQIQLCEIEPSQRVPHLHSITDNAYAITRYLFVRYLGYCT